MKPRQSQMVFAQYLLQSPVNMLPSHFAQAFDHVVTQRAPDIGIELVNDLVIRRVAGDVPNLAKRLLRGLGIVLPARTVSPSEIGNHQQRLSIQ